MRIEIPIAAALLLTLSGCKVGPDYKRPPWSMYPASIAGWRRGPAVVAATLAR